MVALLCELMWPFLFCAVEKVLPHSLQGKDSGTIKASDVVSREETASDVITGTGGTPRVGKEEETTVGEAKKVNL